MINKSPIYQQINEALKILIADDQYAIGDKFLTERAICEQYEVSRATANKALSSLVSQGLLEFKKGVGTFVKAKPSKGKGAQSLIDFSGSVKAAGKTPITKVLICDVIKAGELEDNIAEELKLGPEDEVAYCERLRSAGKIPLIVEYCYIPASYCPDLRTEDLSETLEILLSDKYGLATTATEENIRSVSLDREEADKLDAEPHDAAFALISMGRTGNETPLWLQKAVYKPESLELRYRAETDQMNRRLEGKLII